MCISAKQAFNPIEQIKTAINIDPISKAVKKKVQGPKRQKQAKAAAPAPTQSSLTKKAVLGTGGYNG